MRPELLPLPPELLLGFGHDRSSSPFPFLRIFKAPLIRRDFALQFAVFGTEFG